MSPDLPPSRLILSTIPSLGSSAVLCAFVSSCEDSAPSISFAPFHSTPLPDNVHLPSDQARNVRVPIVQALALVALLHAVTPLVDPSQVTPSQLAEHYGETVEVSGRVTSVSPSGEVVRVELTGPEGTATVLARTRPPPLGSQATVHGQPSPGQSGPVLWAEGAIEADATPAEGAIDVAEARQRAPRLAGAPLAVVGTYAPEEPSLVGPEGGIAVEPVGIAPEPGRAVLWGRLVYEAGQARYELEATGWQAWSPPDA